jgi:hypothetical protein
MEWMSESGNQGSGTRDEGSGLIQALSKPKALIPDPRCLLSVAAS